MQTQYVTRNGSIAIIDGISTYYCWHEDHIMISGKVDGIDCEWNKSGRVRTNVVLGIKDKHELDLVDWIDDSVEGLYYFELKGKNNGR